MRSGFVALGGRPNVGKSTLVNAIVGAKVSIVSQRPQTTRRAVRGIATTRDWQLVLVDLPGMQRPRDALTQRMQHRVERELAESDVALLVLNGEQGVGAGDRFLADSLRGASLPVVVAVNKIDRLDRARTLAALGDAAALDVADDIFPVSARTGRGVPDLTAHLASLLPEGELLYPPDERTDLPEFLHLAELIREPILARMHHELPHAIEVRVEEVEELRPGLTHVRALVWVESESQKGIVVGARGRTIRAIGIAARAELERELRAHVHLELSVRVRRHWRQDEALLDRLGIE